MVKDMVYYNRSKGTDKKNRVATYRKRMKRRKEVIMTTREYFQAVLDAHLSDEMDAASTILLKKLDDRNEKRKSADSKAKQETAARKAAVLAFLKSNEGQHTRDAIAEGTGLTIGQCQSAAIALCAEGKADKAEVKIDKAKRTVYSAK